MTTMTCRNQHIDGIEDDWDLRLLFGLIDKHGLELVLMSLSSYCGQRASQIAAGDAHRAKLWASMEGSIGILVPTALALI